MTKLLPAKVAQILRDNASKYVLAPYLPLSTEDGKLTNRCCALGVLCQELLSPEECLRIAAHHEENPTDAAIIALAAAGYDLEYAATFRGRTSIFATLLWFKSDDTYYSHISSWQLLADIVEEMKPS